MGNRRVAVENSSSRTRHKVLDGNAFLQQVQVWLVRAWQKTALLVQVVFGGTTALFQKKWVMEIQVGES